MKERQRDRERMKKQKKIERCRTINAKRKVKKGKVALKRAGVNNDADDGDSQSIGWWVSMQIVKRTEMR